jgi:2'-5' RNA ligase
MFYAIKFEDTIKNELAENLTEIQKNLSAGSFTEKNNFHITLVFVGETKVENLGNLKKAADNAVIKFNPPPIKIKIDTLGTFPRSGEELLWAGVKTEPENILGKINKAITEQLLKFDIRLQGNDKFHPHVTLARKAKFYKSSKSALPKIKFIPVEFITDSITLMESAQEIKTYSGRRYTQIVYKPVHESKFQIIQNSL